MTNEIRGKGWLLYNSFDVRDVDEWYMLTASLSVLMNQARLEAPFGSEEREKWQDLQRSFESWRSELNRIHKEKTDASN